MMQDKVKNIIISIGFCISLTIVFIINILSPDKVISNTERRKLAQLPEITLEKIIKGDAMEEWDKYVTDQFIARDFFKNIKTFVSRNIFRQKDNNKLFEKDGAIYKIEYPLNKGNIEKSGKKIDAVYNKYLKNMNVYYAIIPDKSYYLENDDHLKIDYNEVKKIMNNELSEMKYIDIWDCLELEDYYRTDLHWKQENLGNVVEKIQEEMKVEKKETNYEIEDKGEFYGTYYGQLGIKTEPDRIYVLTNNIIQNCTTYNFETLKKGTIYEKNKSNDKYDIYLSGATPLITIENPNAKEQRELLMFRDSFGSSIAPLMTEEYSKITLIDLRYMSSELLKDYINFKDQDVLFLYSTVVLNQNILK